ncbi:MAG: outer membrane protein assembly factor BamB [Chromatiales bacterium]|jgi:outer membrane protein assembly factor BamB
MKKALFSLLALLLLSGCGSMADPTTWFGDDEEVGFQPNELTDLKNAIQVKKLWSRDVGAGTDKKQLSLAPRVDLGRVFVADAEGLVQAYDARTGDRLWSVETELPLSGGPGSGEGLVLVGTSDGELLALDAETGAEKWRSQLSSEILSVPAIGLGVVAVHSNDGKLFGLDALTGKQRWLYSHQVPVLTLRGSGSPIVSGSNVICGFAGGKLASIDLDSGRLQWEVTITTPSGRSELERMVDIDGDPLLLNGILFVTTYQGELAAVGELTGTLLWRRDLSSYRSIVADWRNLYVSDASGQVWGINPDNGAAMWKQDKLMHRRLSAPAVVDGLVVVGDYAGYLHWLSHDDGHLVARSRVGSAPISAAPIVRDGVVYVYGEEGDLVAVTPQAGE